MPIPSDLRTGSSLQFSNRDAKVVWSIEPVTFALELGQDFFASISRRIIVIPLFSCERNLA
jgi:hypothetical protein